MATAKKGKDVINLSKEDFEGKFKSAPGGTYTVKAVKSQTKIKPGRSGSNVLQLAVGITKGPHKGINTFDNLAPHVGWKIGQLLAAIGKKTTSLTLKELMALVLAAGEFRAILREKKFEGRKRNEVVQYLPLVGGDEEDDDLDEDEDEDEDDEDEDEDEEDEEEDEDEEDEDEDEDEDDDDDDEEDEEDEEEEDEEEESPPPRRRAKKATPKPAAKKTTRKRARR